MRGAEGAAFFSFQGKKIGDFLPLFGLQTDLKKRKYLENK